MPKKHFSEAPPEVLTSLKKLAGQGTRDDLGWWNNFIDVCQQHDYLVPASAIPMQATKALPSMREKARRDQSWRHAIPKLEAQSKRELMLFERAKQIEETWGQEMSREERAFDALVEARAAEIHAENQRKAHEQARGLAAKELSK